MRSLVLVFSFLAVLGFSLNGCSGVTSSSCDTIATLSAETARFICNSLTSTRSQITRGDLTPGQREEISQRMEIVRDYLQAQERTSSELANYFRRQGDGDRARDQDTRFALLQDLTAETELILARIRQ